MKKSYCILFFLLFLANLLQAQSLEPLRSSYFAACYSSNFEDIKYHVEKRKIDVDTILLEGRTGLHLAVLDNKIEIVRYFLEKGANVNKAENSGYTPLHIAAGRLNVEMVKLLVEKGANINDQNTAQGYSPLHIAAADARGAAILEYLISKGA